ncbi:MAG: efflux RND transporter permease subunit [Rhodobacteraceae bacterium]|nr:efflux RND transporter permease subunit [Paracoccaceae bacterium]
MTALVDWAAARARMILAFIALSLVAGGLAYLGLPKEGEPDIEVPVLFVSVPFPGISAEDSETLLVRPMETELSGLEGLKRMSAIAAEGYAAVALEFEFGWDKTKVIADLRDAMGRAEARFPSGVEQYSINEINFSEFPIVIVNLSGAVPERTLLRLARQMQDRIEALEPVLEAPLAGHRDEMLEVVIDPLRLEAYNVSAEELIAVVVNNNRLIAAGEVETPDGAFAVKIPASFGGPRDVRALPVKVNGDRVVTLGDLADIRLTFEDRAGTARYNGDATVALQVVKRKGFNLIDTVALVRAAVAAETADWPPELRRAVRVDLSNDQSVNVAAMVGQLEGSVLTAIALVMIVVLAALGPRSALLVGFAIPTSFLLCFALLAVMGIAISNIVMFGLILAVGMLVDGAIVVVEHADKRIAEGSGPMRAYVEAARRMFWPVVSSTATTLCAFLPMLFWPGVAGEFMAMLPVTLIFVLSASLVVALIFLPVLGGVAGRLTRRFDQAAAALRPLPWALRAALVVPAAWLAFAGAMQLLDPDYLVPAAGLGPAARLPGVAMFLAGAALTGITVGAARPQRRRRRVVEAGYRRTLFGRLIALIAGNPVMPLLTVGAVGAFVVAVFGHYAQHNRGVEFFVESEPEQVIVYVRARGNLSLAEKDALVGKAERAVAAIEGLDSIFAFAGSGGLRQNTGGGQAPLDTIGQLQIELAPWEDRRHDPDLDGDLIVARIEAALDRIPGIRTEILNLSRGPSSGKPLHLRLKGEDRGALAEAVRRVEARLARTPGIIGIENTLPLPGIDWQIDVDVEKAGRFGADVATVGAMVQLVTRGLLLDTMRVEGSGEEIEIRVRLPAEDRVLATLDELRVRTSAGLVPLANFVTRRPVAKLGRIDRVDQQRHYDVKADVAPGLVRIDDAAGRPLAVVPAPEAAERLAAADAAGGRAVPVTANERIAAITAWLEAEAPLPAGVSWEWTGDQEDQAESQAFLMQAFAGALGLMFVILLAQFNSFYNAVLVLLAVVLSTTGVLIGMLVMDQPFSVIMTGVGIVALAGIVVNNNIVLIDTYQELSGCMPKLEAIVRTAEQRIRPVLLTTITTMAGLAPMMFGLSLDFVNGGYTIDSPTALWWKQLATAVVFGLGIATVLTLVLTPALLALRVWLGIGADRLAARIRALALGRESRAARDLAQQAAWRRRGATEIVWDAAAPPESAPQTRSPAAEPSRPTARRAPGAGATPPRRAGAT